MEERATLDLFLLAFIELHSFSASSASNSGPSKPVSKLLERSSRCWDKVNVRRFFMFVIAFVSWNTDNCAWPGMVVRHWQTAATAAPVRHQGLARGEAEVFGLARPRDGATACSRQCRNRRRRGLNLVPKIYFMNSFHFREGLKYYTAFSLRTSYLRF